MCDHVQGKDLDENCEHWPQKERHKPVQGMIRKGIKTKIACIVCGLIRYRMSPRSEYNSDFPIDEAESESRFSWPATIHSDR